MLLLAGIILGMLLAYCFFWLIVGWKWMNED